MIDVSKYKQTNKGLELTGSGEALKMNIKKYPTYKDFLKNHNEHFKVREKIRSLGL